MAGKFSETITADAFVVLAAALYLGFETKVSWPGPACSMAAPPGVLGLGGGLSKVAFRAVAMSESFMALPRIVAEGGGDVAGLRFVSRAELCTAGLTNASVH